MIDRELLYLKLFVWVYNWGLKHYPELTMGLVVELANILKVQKQQKDYKDAFARGR
jgi:hypothetical protein